MTEKDKDHTKKIRNILRALEILEGEAANAFTNRNIDEMRNVCSRLNDLINLIRDVDVIAHTIAKRCKCEEEELVALMECIKDSIFRLREFFQEQIPKDIAIAA